MNIRIGRYEVADVEGGLDALDDDPRGIVWVWEKPRPNAQYVVSCDPSYGKAGWHRSLRVEKDREIDNCAIEVVRLGNPQVQVAEFAAPIDAEEAAPIVNALGRMYGGASEDGQALAIIEVHPGPGLMTQRDLINKFNYTNLFVWQHLDKFTVKETQSYGWYSSRQSRQMLWIRGTKHINEQKVIINSPWLVDEMTACQKDAFLAFTARAAYGYHDDRLVAFLINLWAANIWNEENAPEEAALPQVVNAPDWQASDVTAEDMMMQWNERFAALRGE